MTHIPSPLDSIIETIESLKQEGDYMWARQTAIEALKQHTDDYRLYEELADIYLFENDIQNADAVLQVARTLHPSSGTGMYLDGYIATVKWEFDRAIEILEQANKDLPNNAEILRKLWWAYFMQSNNPKWLALLRRAYSLAPEESMIINDLAVVLMTSGEEDEARKVLWTIGQEWLIDAIKKHL